jgi:hypothetical protein
VASQFLERASSDRKLFDVVEARRQERHGDRHSREEVGDLPAAPAVATDEVDASGDDPQVPHRQIHAGEHDRVALELSPMAPDEG